MGSGDVARLLDKPVVLEKVYIVGYRSCSFDATGKLPARTQAFVEEVKGKIELADTTLYWIVSAVDARAIWLPTPLRRPDPVRLTQSSAIGTN